MSPVLSLTFWHRTFVKQNFLTSKFYDRSASNHFLFTLLYKTAVVETPQSALWLTQNTTKRLVAYSKHHKALCGVLVWDLSLKTGWPVYSHIITAIF